MQLFPPSGLGIQRVVRLLHSGLDWIYPPLCPGCDAVVLPPDGTGSRQPLCDSCENHLSPLVAPFCQICGQAYESQGTQDLHCANCGDRQFSFEFAIAPFLSTGILRDMIHRFKFGREMALRVPLGHLFARVFSDPRLHGDDWLLVPVPIHRSRLRQRSFNQSTELARILSKETQFPVVPALRRKKSTPPQSRLNRQQRIENLTGAMVPVDRCQHKVAGRNILLVDDIFTTGSTCQACAEVLIENGARKVVVITLARG